MPLPTRPPRVTTAITATAITATAISAAATATALVLVLALTTAACASGNSDSAGPTSAAPSNTEATLPTTSLDPPPCSQTSTKVTVAYSKIAGFAPNTTSVDVYPAPRVCNTPVVMWVHGGGYQVGDKAQQIDDKVRIFNLKGWMLVSVNYRLTTPGKPRTAQFPDHYNDVAGAVAWVHSNIASYGGDPTRIALLGHSAGADIVSNVATNPAYLGQLGLDLSVLTCAGPLDTEGFNKTASGSGDFGDEKQQWAKALGNNPSYLTDTSATGLIKPGIHIPPMIGVYRGTPKRQQIEIGFLEALAAAGIGTARIDARSLTHAEVNRRIGAIGERVMTAPLVGFLTNCFR